MWSMLKFTSVTSRVTLLLTVLVAISITVMASLGYAKLSQVTTSHSEIRIDRAARAASSILNHALNGQFDVIHDMQGRPIALRMQSGEPSSVLSFQPLFDDLLKEIGSTNQGAANLFRLNSETKGFDRFATTFRKPDGTMPPPMSISEGHPAWADISNNRVHVGEVPVMGRMRLAYLTPIQAQSGAVAGALAVDVGWADDLTVARDELRSTTIVTSGIILLIVVGFGILCITSALAPLRKLAAFANDVAAGENSRIVPYFERNDEVGALAQGLSRVVDLQTELAYLAYTDELTGLGNRARYLADLSKAVTDSLEGKGKWALAHIDIDRFKDTNDAFGQVAGDDLLKCVGKAICEAVPQSAKVARLAGDSFAVLIPHHGEMTELVGICDKLLMKLAEPILLKQGAVSANISFGVALLPKDAKSADEAHRNADIALRKAKDEGGGRFVFFAEEMNVTVQNQIAMERMLRQAIDNRDFTIFYQPQINPFNNELVGLEALARWPHAKLGMIPPNDFIPIAESTGLIVELGAILMDKACHQAREWLDEGFDFKYISVNVSPIQLWQPNFIKMLKNTLERYNLSGQHICVELTESVFVDHSGDKVNRVLEQIRGLGIMLSLDDFGSGYSSLGYLTKLPFEQLKVDRSFVSGVDRDVRKQNLLRGIVALGQGLGLSIVVEGAETREEIIMIKLIGSHAIQGYFYARPMPANDVISAIDKITNAPFAETQSKIA